MGHLLCRVCCNRHAENGDALDALVAGERPEGAGCLAVKKTWAEQTLEDFLHLKKASCKDRANLHFMMWMSCDGFPRTNPALRTIPFGVANSPFVKGLQLLEPLQLLGPSASGAEQAEQQTVTEQMTKALAGSKKLIVGSVRMGYGHHRIAYSVLSWALELGIEPYLLDILSPQCIEADIVKNMDKQYSKMSRLASRFGGCVDDLWGKMMLTGNANMLRFFLTLAAKIRPIMAGLPRDVPIVSTHPIIGDMAIACGFKKVINLVFDNHPQYFILVPQALNLVQSPSYFDKLLDMGCPARHLQLAGHWVSSDICLNAVADSEARIARCNKTELPRRFLIAVGGAGAQAAFLDELLEALAEHLRGKRIRLFVNCGDHKHIADLVLKKMNKLAIEFNEVTTSEQTEALCRGEPLSAVAEPPDWKPVTVLRFADHFAAFRCTDLVIRIADVLVTKPSELAFFPVPKLHIRRVGAHEAFSAMRSTELGDGTTECRTVPHTVKKLEQLIEDRSPLFMMMNSSIIKAAKEMVYEGSRVACERAFSA